MINVTLCKILNFPPKCISVLYQLPLIFSSGVSHHSTEPPHKNTVLWCQGCPRPLWQCRGHQRLLAKAGNSKFYRVPSLEGAINHTRPHTLVKTIVLLLTLRAQNPPLDTLGHQNYVKETYHISYFIQRLGQY